MEKIKKIFTFNPYIPLSKAIGLMFWPLTIIPWIKRDIQPVLRLINKLFVNSKTSPFLSFWFPLLLILILGRVGSSHYIITGIASIIPIIIGVLVMPSIIISLRNSSILKRIGATNTKTSDLSIAIIFYFSIIAILSSLINTLIGHIMYQDDIHYELFNWGQYLLVSLIGIIIAMSFGMLISSFLKKEQAALLAGMLLTLPGAFLSAQFLSPAIVNDWGPIRYIAFIFPQKIVVGFMYAVTNNHSVFDVSDVVSSDFYALSTTEEIIDKLKASAATNGFTITSQHTTFINQFLNESKNKFEVVSQLELIIAWVLAPIEIVLFSVLSSFTFKWGIR